MNWKCEKVHESPLRPARTEEEYHLHQAALEWSLAEAIVIQSAEDIQSKANWRERLEPFDHQVQNLFTFCRRLPVTLLADDVGLGKTISAGLILSELTARRRVSRALVICPKILCPQWVEELEGKFGIRGRAAFGGDLRAELAGSSPVVVTTYESAADRLADIRPAAFDLLVLDEAHKLRNLHGGNKPPKMATAVRDALHRRLFKFVVMLTATPIQNRLWDLYSLLDCLTVAKGHKNPLGTPDEFKSTYLQPGSDGRQLRPAKAEAFRRILRQYVVRTRRGDARLLFPSREVRLLRIDLSPQEQQLNRLVAQHIGGMNPLQQTSLAQAMMSSPPALAAQLENMAAQQPSLGAAARQARALAADCAEPAKLRRLLSLCDELKASRPDWRLVVFTQRKETQGLIVQALARRGIRSGCVQGGAARANQAAIEQFRARPPLAHVLVSTDAGAEGINLQAANVLVNYDLPWNPMVVEQRIGRLQRLASEHGHVVVCNLVATRSVEERVVSRLMEKLQSIAQAIGDIESILESSAWDGDADRFEKQVRELVVMSLLGQDVERATLMARQSIERARVQIEEQRAEIDQTLGRLDELHHSGPRMPRLERRAPSVTAQDFVLRARRAEGGQVVEASPGAYEVRAGGRPGELITFDERTAEQLSSGARFMGRVRLYQPGKADFERLVQHWVDRCGHRIHDLRPQTDHAAQRLARAWCETIPEGQFLGCEVAAREATFQGHARVRVKASNGVDGYEKLVAARFHPDGHQAVQPPPGSAVLAEEILPSEVIPDCSSPLTRVVEADRDVAGFCRFYSERRAEELARVGGDPRLAHKVNEDFSPSIAADVVGLQGVCYDQTRILVHFSIRGEGNYSSALRAVPASGQVLEEPPRKECDHTGLHVPAECLERCELTGMLVLGHLLGESEVSGRRGMRDRIVVCQVTGTNALDDEVSCSGVSGTVGLKSEFVTCRRTGCLLLADEAGESAVSGGPVRKDLLVASEKPPHRLGLSDELGVCEATGRRLLADELYRSAVSGKLVDRDVLRPSSRSGKPALPEELVTCQESGATLLPEETGTCVITGKRVDTRLLARSEVSGGHALAVLLERCGSTGKLALPTELAVCEVTGSRVLPGELAVCAETGKQALRTRMAVCWRTGDLLLPSEAGRSDYSGRTFRKGLLQPSEKPPGRLGLAEEFGVCELTGRRLLLDELAHSAVSGRLTDRQLLRPSARSGSLALPGELVRCEESGAELLPAETARCAVTGLAVDTRLLSRSEVSGVAALTRVMGRCASTRRLALPAELAACELTGARVLPDQLGRCSVTGKSVLLSRLVTCARTGRLALVSETGESAVSGLVVLKDLLTPSEKPPHRLGIAEELAVCEATGRRLLADETGVSAVSGKRVDREGLVRSARSGSLALRSEMVACEVSGELLLPSETGRCSVTGKVVDSRRLAASERSGRVAMSHLLRRCAVTGKLVLDDELERCELSGGKVIPEELAKCSVTGKRCIRGMMLRSDVSGKYVIPGQELRSAVSGKIALPEEAVRCAWLEQPILRTEAKRCTLTRKVVARSLLNQDGELAVLRQLLDGRSREAVRADELIPKIRALDETFFGGIRHAWVVRSPRGGKIAVCAEIHSWFGLKVRHVGFVARAGEELQVAGWGVLGYRSHQGWVHDDDVEFD